jgi:NADPH:quinone reductase-like Zn-dependent oxidoreductase
MTTYPPLVSDSEAPTHPASMRAVVVREGASASSLAWELVAAPRPQKGEVLVRVLATTVISSEIASREGVSTARLPLILGNDFVGIVVEAPTAPSLVGRRVIGAYGGYGYTRDGAWADFIVVDENDAFPVETDLDDVTLASMPGSFTAASGALRSLGDLAGRTLLIRGGSSGVGLAAATLAIDAGARVISTTRDPGKADRMRELGIHEIVIDDGDLVANVISIVPGGTDLALDMLGTASIAETMRCVHDFGLVCLTGLLRDQTRSIESGQREDRSIDGFPHPMELIPPTKRLTIGGVDGTARTAALMQEWVDGLASGRFQMPIDSTFSLDEIQDAHRRRADPAAFGKVVVLVGGEAAPTNTPRSAPADTRGN